MVQTFSPYNHELRGGSRGWRRHVRRWKSAHRLAERGDKAARTWLAKHNLPVPPHPNQRSRVQVVVTPERTHQGAHARTHRLVWAGLPTAAFSNRCPTCWMINLEETYQDTDQGRKRVLTCNACKSNYRPYEQPAATPQRSGWWG